MKDAIVSLLPPEHPWRNRLTVFDCVDSTNDTAKAMAADNAPHGTVLIANRQTGGRGRRGRSFYSPGGMGIYLSVILRPNCPAQMLMHLTCAVAVAMCDAVQAATGFMPGIKWTNDLVAQGKKLAGILTELSIDPATKQVSSAIIGAGINCCQKSFPAELQDTATSLAMLTGCDVSRERLAAAMITALAQMDQTLLSQKKRLMEAYRARCVTIGQDVAVLWQGHTSYGTALDVTDDGALIVRKSDGELISVVSGEVSIRKIDGYA